MTQKEILEYNKRCAEFLSPKNTLGGYYFPEFGLYVQRYGEIDYEEVFTLKEMKFHSDWNWIMKVAEAIEKLDDNFYFVKINTGGCFIHPLNDTKDYKGICYQAGKTKKEAVVQAINQFLIWYEKQK